MGWRFSLEIPTQQFSIYFQYCLMKTCKAFVLLKRPLVHGELLIDFELLYYSNLTVYKCKEYNIRKNKLRSVIMDNSKIVSGPELKKDKMNQGGQKKSHGRLIKLVLLTLLLIAAVAVKKVLSREPSEQAVDFDGYVPKGEFCKAYNALQNRVVDEANTANIPKSNVNRAENNLQTKADGTENDLQPETDITKNDLQPKADNSADETTSAILGVENGPDGYNLEKTIQTIRSIELAQKESGDWIEFLTFLAKQDYEGVPKEVTQALSRILPIMERMHDIEKEIGENKGTMAALNSIGEGAMTVVGKVDTSTLATLSAIPGGIGTLLKAPEMLDAGMNAVFESYKNCQMKRKTLTRKLREVQLAYIAYLSNYLPIRRKYDKEWDELCLAKDKVYLQVDRGQYEEALVSTQNIMKRYPYDRETILLRSLSLTRLAFAESQKLPLRVKPVELKPVDELPTVSENPMLTEASDLLERYLCSYPDSSGPALVLKGLTECVIGDIKHAMVSFDQSAIEYPRQAAKLNNMLEVYASRPHLEMTAEGQCLLRLHRSLCEGFGPFSPNLEKAFAYEREQRYDKSREEIYKHFFRRGNQEVFHELFSDMEFCEKNLTIGFNGLLMEHSFFDLEVKNAGWRNTSDRLKIALRNRTDFELKNVRVFLCVQFTEMYVGEYDVMKVGSVGRLASGDCYEFPELILSRPNKTYNDISHVRAIVMADDRICWVDPIDEKRKHANDVMTGTVRVDLPFTPEEYLAAFGTDSIKLGKMAEEIPVARMKRMMIKDELELSLPRVFAVLDPVFTIGEIGGKDCVYPSEKTVAGSKIVLRFPVSVKSRESVFFCIYSDYANFKVQLKHTDDAIVVGTVAPIMPLRRE